MRDKPKSIVRYYVIEFDLDRPIRVHGASGTQELASPPSPLTTTTEDLRRWHEQARVLNVNTLADVQGWHSLAEAIKKQASIPLPHFGHVRADKPWTPPRRFTTGIYERRGERMNRSVS